MITDLYPGVPEAEAWALFRRAEARARELGGDSLAGWEVVCESAFAAPPGAQGPFPHNRGARFAVRILSDVPTERPEGGPCRLLTVEVPGRGLRFVYESQGTSGSLGLRIARALDPSWTFLGLRPPSEDYWRSLPGWRPPGRPVGSPDDLDESE